MIDVGPDMEERGFEPSNVNVVSGVSVRKTERNVDIKVIREYRK